jgi:hypothetical protein
MSASGWSRVRARTARIRKKKGFESSMEINNKNVAELSHFWRVPGSKNRSGTQLARMNKIYPHSLAQCNKECKLRLLKK